MRERARERSLPFDSKFFTNDYLMGLIRSTPTCECCGCAINYDYKSGVRQNDSPSIDRFNPSEGYVAGNVTLICWRCNNLKRDATPEELEMVARWMRSKPL